MKSLYGPPKLLTDISLADMQKHPIWLWCINLNLPDESDGPLGGNETSMRPWLGDSNVTAEMEQPSILLRVEGTELWGSGFFDRERRKLDAIGIFGRDWWRPPDYYLPDPVQQITYKAVPRIGGKPCVRFTAKNGRRTEAYIEGSGAAKEAATTTTALADGAVASSLQTHPALLDVVAAFVANVGKLLLSEGHTAILPYVAGHLQDEAPELYAQLLRKCEGAGVAVLTPSSPLELVRGVLRIKRTGEHCAIVVACEISRLEDDGYLVKGYWCDNEEDIHTVSHKVVGEGGPWRKP
jgi:hypothetical protein